MPAPTTKADKPAHTRSLWAVGEPRSSLIYVEELSNAAALALASLCAHPDLDTPDLISNGPYRLQQVDDAAIHNGLLELERYGLAGERFGGWTLTPAGRDRCG